VSNQLVEHFGDQVFRSIVPRNVRLAEAPSHGLSIVEYDRSSRGAVAYLALAGEVVRQHPKSSAPVAANQLDNTIIEPASAAAAEEQKHAAPGVKPAEVE